jgi:AraC-like DNA-binding protein
VSGAAPAVPDEPIRNARAYLQALGRLGYDTVALATAVGIPLDRVDDADARVPCTTVAALFTQAMAARPLQNLSLQLAMQTPIGAFPMIDYLVLTSDTVGRGLEQLARYLRLTSTTMSWRFETGEDPVRIVFEQSGGELQREYDTALCVLHLRRETEDRFRAAYVSFTQPLDDAGEFERVLGCPVRTGAAFNGLAATREAWELPLRRRDPVLRAVLERQADDMMRRLPAFRGLGHVVRQLLVTRVSGGDVDIASVARELAMSPRSLQRRLSEEGVSYQSLVDVVRKGAAERYLQERSLSVSEIAFLLGYSEPAAFHRAFRRWYGTTPQGYRGATRAI